MASHLSDEQLNFIFLVQDPFNRLTKIRVQICAKEPNPVKLVYLS